MDVLPLSSIQSIEAYDAVVLGAPMIMGFHRSALGFLRRQRKSLQRIPLAVFVMAMSLTRTDEAAPLGVSLVVDPNLPKPPGKAGKLTLKERYARVSNYARPILAALRPAKPVSLAFFGGRLDYGRLKWWAVVFAMLVIQAPAGERRNWEAIRAWAAGLPAALSAKA